MPCAAPYASPIPGLYTWVVSYGNVVGHTYTQDNANPAGFQSAYEVWLYYPTPTPSPLPSPTASSPPGSPMPTPTVTGTFSPPPTPVPTTTPPPMYEKITTYVGTYTMPSFDFQVDGKTYATNESPGCAQIELFQEPNGTAGQDRRRDVQSYGGDNTMAFGNEPPPLNIGLDPVYDGAISSMTITNLTPSSGNATITLDNGTVGTMTITGSSTATVETIDARRARKPTIDRRQAARFLETYGPPPVR